MLNSLSPPNSICFLSSESFISHTFGIQVPNVQQIQYCSHVSICKHSFNPQCPILNLVKIIYSLLFLPVIFLVPTFCCILYKYLPFSSLSQLLCHFFHNFNPNFCFSVCFTYWDWYINIFYFTGLFCKNHLPFNFLYPYMCWHPCTFYLHPQQRNHCVTF